MGRIAAILLAGIVAPGPAQADKYDALRADEKIENGVLIVAIGDIVRDYCPNFEARRMRSILFLNGLVGRAKDLGYSMDEIRAYVDSDAEKERVGLRARQWLLQEGADFDRPATLCRIARDQIARDTAIGSLIRER